jgi:hypothetical protein
MATVMKWILALLACALPCMGQLTLQNAHYPTIFLSGGSAQPPVSGAVIWVTPDSLVYTNAFATGNVAVAGGSGVASLIRYWEDMSGNGNHLTNLDNFCPRYSTNTLNGKRLVRFGYGETAPAIRTYLQRLPVSLGSAGNTVFVVAAKIAPAAAEGNNVDFVSYGGPQGFRKDVALNQLTAYNDNSGSYISYSTINFGLGVFWAGGYRFDNAGNTRAVLMATNSGIVASGADSWAGNANTNFTVGYRFNVPNTELAGEVAEVIAYGSALTDLQCSNVVFWLRAKYSIMQ